MCLNTQKHSPVPSALLVLVPIMQLYSTVHPKTISSNSFLIFVSSISPQTIILCDFNKPINLITNFPFIDVVTWHNTPLLQYTNLVILLIYC